MAMKAKTFFINIEDKRQYYMDDCLYKLREAAEKGDYNLNDHINLLQEVATRKQYFVFLKILEDLNFRLTIDKEEFRKQPLKNKLLDGTYDLNQLSEEDKENIMQNNF